MSVCGLTEKEVSNCSDWINNGETVGSRRERRSEEKRSAEKIIRGKEGRVELTKINEQSE